MTAAKIETDNLQGVDLLRAAISHIVAHPESWDQTVLWHKGHRHCLFGICEILGRVRVTPDRTFDAVRQLLNLPETEAYWLASPNRTLEEIRWFFREWMMGRVGTNNSEERYDVAAWDRLDARFRRWKLRRKLQRKQSQQRIVSLV